VLPRLLSSSTALAVQSFPFFSAVICIWALNQSLPVWFSSSLSDTIFSHTASESLWIPCKTSLPYGPPAFALIMYFYVFCFQCVYSVPNFLQHSVIYTRLCVRQVINGKMNDKFVIILWWKECINIMKHGDISSTCFYHDVHYSCNSLSY